MVVVRLQNGGGMDAWINMGISQHGHRADWQGEAVFIPGNVQRRGGQRLGGHGESHLEWPGNPSLNRLRDEC